MNTTLKDIITNPFVIGSGLIGGGILGGVFVWSRKRPKTDAEIELEKLKERNAEAEREREHQREIEKIRARQAAEAVESEEKTKRDAKAAEERTKQMEIDLEKVKERHEWERTAPDGYWRVKEAQAHADGVKAAADKEAQTQREIARLQADAAKATAEATARSNERRDYYDYRRVAEAAQADAAKTQALYGGIAQIVNGVVKN